MSATFSEQWLLYCESMKELRLTQNLQTFCELHGIKVYSDGSFKESSALELLFPYNATNYCYDPQRGDTSFIGEDGRPINICPSSIVVPELSSKGWAKSWNNAIYLHPIDLTRYCDMPLGSFQVELGRVLKKYIVGRFYKPEDLLKNDFVDLVIEDAEQAICNIKEQIKFFPQKPENWSDSYKSVNFVKDDIEILGKSLGWYYANQLELSV